MTAAAWLSITLPIVWFYWGPPWAAGWALVTVALMGWRRPGVWVLGGALVLVLLVRLEWELERVLPRVEQHKAHVLTVCLDQPARDYGDYQAAVVRVVDQPEALTLRRVRVTAEPEVALVPGECLVAKVRLRQPLGRLVPGNFNPTRYYFSERIDALATLVEVERRFTRPSVPTRLYRRAEPVFAGSQALGVWAALALGWSGALDDSLSDVFEQNQIKHLVVVSGMHVGMVAAWALFACGLLMRVPGADRLGVGLMRLVSVAAASGAFVALTGFGFPGVRAWVMLVIPLTALALGFRLSSTQVLASAAVAIAVLQPQAWLDSGAWLSFGLVAVLVRLAERWRSLELPTWQLAIRLQLALSVLMVPVGSVMGFDWHPLSIPINLVMIPLVTLVVLPWSLVILAMPTLAWVPGYESLVSIGIEVLDVLADWHASSPAWTGLEVGLVGVGLWFLLSQMVAGRQRWLLVPMLAIVGLGPRTSSAPEAFRMTMLDVGHGEAILLEWPDATWLYDTAGQWSDGRSIAAQRLAGWFKRRDIELDGILVSHADLDHVGGAAWAVHQWPAARRLAGEPDAVASIARARGWQDCHALAEDASLTFRVLPIPKSFRVDSNAHSCVIAIDTPSGRVLITGDADRLVEYWLLQAFPEVFPVAIQVIGHHGSHTSSASAFLDASPDALLLVSSGDRASPRWPSRPLLTYLGDRGRPLTSTARRGTVTVVQRDGGWRALDRASAFRERLLE
ncbi:DNA internalization-related competence protein ComEC/Rec2 [Saccharospirillum salsuginis]|uniref:DNA internalization-related competence protein ComEC/Rec2 n=1 Tax=Saccharospirillum salsuginis TaxID=418750 RepID=UPI001671B6B0|nr:DNA internalization-related competence protein ComEC/Rec2 [Saccharospirillum salsuginis]